jgi:hypothetical protein
MSAFHRTVAMIAALLALGGPASASVDPGNSTCTTGLSKAIFDAYTTDPATGLITPLTTQMKAYICAQVWDWAQAIVTAGNSGWSGGGSPDGGTSITLAGDATGNSSANAVVRIQGRAVDAMTSEPGDGWIFEWSHSGLRWVPADPAYLSVSHASTAGSCTNGLVSTGSYSDPSWLTSIAGSKVSGNISGKAATCGTADVATNGLVSTDSYSSPSWLTAISGGIVSGAVASATTCAQLQGYAVDSGAPTSGRALVWDGSKWTATAPGGDLGGTWPSATVGALQGHVVDNAAPSSGDVLAFSSSAWRPTTASGLSVSYASTSGSAGSATTCTSCTSASSATTAAGLSAILVCASGGLGIDATPGSAHLVPISKSAAGGSYVYEVRQPASSDLSDGPFLGLHATADAAGTCSTATTAAGLSSTLGTGSGGTGITTAPTAATHVLGAVSSGAGFVWSERALGTGDIPSLSATYLPLHAKADSCGAADTATSATSATTAGSATSCGTCTTAGSCSGNAATATTLATAPTAATHVWAGTGGAAPYTWTERALATTDIPSLSATYLPLHAKADTCGAADTATSATSATTAGSATTATSCGTATTAGTCTGNAATATTLATAPSSATEFWAGTGGVAPFTWTHRAITTGDLPQIPTTGGGLGRDATPTASGQFLRSTGLAGGPYSWAAPAALISGDIPDISGTYAIRSRSISTTTGQITGGGDLSADRTLGLATAGPGAGSATNASLTIDAYGRVTALSSGSAPITSVSGSTGVSCSGSPGATCSLSSVGPGASSYTNANITINAQGQVTAASSGASGAGARTSVNAQVQTTSASQTVLTTYAIPANSVVTIMTKITARQASSTSSAGWGVAGTYYNSSGTATLVGTNTTLWSHNSTGWSVAYTVSGASVRMSVTGGAGATVNWSGTMEVEYAP